MKGGLLGGYGIVWMVTNTVVVNGQLFYVHVETGDEWYPQGPVFRQVFFNIFVNNLDSVICCTPIKFVDDTELGVQLIQ